MPIHIIVETGLDMGLPDEMDLYLDQRMTKRVQATLRKIPGVVTKWESHVIHHPDSEDYTIVLVVETNR